MNGAARLRSVLIAPADQPALAAKLPRSDPDGVMLDLEDAVAPHAKETARIQAGDSVAMLRRDHAKIAVFVRVNAVLTDWFDADVEAMAGLDLAGLVVPKLETVAQLAQIREALTRAGMADLPIVAGIESALGVEHVAELLVAPVTIAYFGAEDYVADLGGVRTEDNLEVLYARSRVALATRTHHVYALDQIVAAFDQPARFERDAAQGRALGFRGKLCIHPAQVGVANRVFSPSPHELDRARRLVDAYDAAIAAGVGVIAFEGQMVDEPLAKQARALLGAAED